LAFFTFFFSFSFDLGSSAFAFGAAFDSSAFAFGAAFAASAGGGFNAFAAPADDGFAPFCSLLAESVFVFELLAGSLFVAKAEAFAAALSGGLGAIQSGSAAEKPEGLTAPQEAKVSKIVSRVDETSFGLGAHDGAVEKGNFSGQQARGARARARTRKELDGVSCFT
jgi:hypothetical protein